MDRPGKHTTPAIRTHHLRGFASGQNAACAGSFWRESMQFSRFAGSLTRSGGRGLRLKPAYRMMGEPVNRLGGAGTGNRSRLTGEGIRGATAAGSLPLEPTYHRMADPSTGPGNGSGDPAHKGETRPCATCASLPHVGGSVNLSGVSTGLRLRLTHCVYDTYNVYKNV
jgi:hypothetical protein